jgi:hypothetical protein
MEGRGGHRDRVVQGNCDGKYSFSSPERARHFDANELNQGELIVTRDIDERP